MQKSAMPCRSPNWGRSILLALIAGFAGAIVNTIAIRLTKMIGIQPGTGGLSELVLAHGNFLLQVLGVHARLPVRLNPVNQELFHTAMGLLMALVYAVFFYRRLPGPGWLRGFLFCQIPWLLQVFLVLPWIGAGIFGWRLSLFTPFASFVLNGLYGITLGVIYRPLVKQTSESKAMHDTP